MEQATAAQATTEQPPAIDGGVEERLAGLRTLAESQPGAARDAAWLWIKEAGERGDVAELDEIFRRGNVPSGLDGPTDGILVTPQIHPALDWFIKAVTPLWMPWSGKRFNAASSTGDNRLVDSARVPSKLIWPRYEARDAPEGGKLAFDFETRVEPGKHDPKTQVLVIDYAPIEENPGLLIRSIRDELVEVVPGTNLGKILYRRSSGDYRSLGFFALRPPR
jgi:hypothetical protein